MYKKIISLLAACLCLYGLYRVQKTQKIIVTDFSNFYHASVDRIEYPKNIIELRNIILKAHKPIALAGGKYSMGGQTWCQDGIVIDMKHIHAITAFDQKKKTITVQAGACWRKVQDFLHKYNLSITVMQSYNDFSVGGSLSVNVHGRDPHGQIIETVESISVMLADGSLVKASRTENPDLFSAVIGGYGACGIIIDATLRLEKNYKIKRLMKIIPINEFTTFYNNSIKNNKDIGLFNANLYSPHFDKIISFAWYKTDTPLTIFSLAHQYDDQSNIVRTYQSSILEYAISEFHMAKKLRFLLDKKIIKNNNYVVWRSYEMSESVNNLAPSDQYVSKILQEYFIPVQQFQNFVDALKKIIAQNHIKILNISIRYVPKNNESILTYASEDSFAFVCYIAINNTKQGHEETRLWTQALINAAINVGGTYYLPYHLFALPDQFIKSYPNYPTFLAIKQKYDPTNIFQNSLTQACEKYYKQSLSINHALNS